MIFLVNYGSKKSWWFGDYYDDIGDEDDSDLFTIEHDGGEDDDGHGERENKEAELGRAGLKDCFKNFFLFLL